MDDERGAGTREGEWGEQAEQTLEWWCWGAGTHGQLGTGAFQDELLPQPLPPPSSSPLVHLACGGSHCVAALRSGEALTWGNGSSGQLGHGDLQSCCKPALIKELQAIKVKIVSAGWSHTAFISEDHQLFTCGSGGYGQLGHGNLDSCSSPNRVMEFCSTMVYHVACGMRHTLVVDDSGKGKAVYAFGSSRKGQLGIGVRGDGSFVSKEFSVEANRICHPYMLESLNGCDISYAYANGDHSAALSGNGHVYIWGRGFGTKSNIFRPFKIPSNLAFCEVALGWNHLLALSYDGRVYATGSEWNGALNAIKKPSVIELPHGIESTYSRRQESSSSGRGCAVHIELFERLKGSPVKSVAAGSEHSAAILSDGSVVTWGWGEHGQLGSGTTEDQSYPEVVADLPKLSNARVYCGCGFTYLCRTLTGPFIAAPPC